MTVADEDTFSILTDNAGQNWNQIALHVGKDLNQCLWRHMLVKFWADISETNLDLMQVAFFLAG